jgi:hypothetical protein
MIGLAFLALVGYYFLMDRREYWLHAGGAFEFDGDGHWSEWIGKRRTAEWQEVARTRDSIEIQDADRHLRYKLDKASASIQEVNGSWSKIFSGAWSNRGAQTDESLTAKGASRSTVPYVYKGAGKECPGGFWRTAPAKWREETPGIRGCIESAFDFDELGITPKGILLHDPSRRLYVRLPFETAGWIMTSQLAEGAWSNLHIQSEPDLAEDTGIRIAVATASYGLNCRNDAAGNATLYLKTGCDGKDICSFPVQDAAGKIGDHCPGTQKEFIVTYTCGSKEKTLRVDKEAVGKTAFLTCRE